MRKTFTITAYHEDDIFDLRLKQLHVGFRNIGIKTFPTDYVKPPFTNKDYESVQSFNVSIRNTWHGRNKSEENLLILEKSLKTAEKRLQKQIANQ